MKRFLVSILVTLMLCNSTLTFNIVKAEEETQEEVVETTKEEVTEEVNQSSEVDIVSDEIGPNIPKELSDDNLLNADSISNGVLTISEGTTSISSYAYENRTDIKEVIFPSTLVSIEYYAFRGCTSIKSIYIYQKQ